jgi:hypothetical protein
MNDCFYTYFNELNEFKYQSLRYNVKKFYIKIINTVKVFIYYIIKV